MKLIKALIKIKLVSKDGKSSGKFFDQQLNVECIVEWRGNDGYFCGDVFLTQNLIVKC